MVLHGGETCPLNCVSMSGVCLSSPGGATCWGGVGRHVPLTVSMSGVSKLTRRCYMLDSRGGVTSPLNCASMSGVCQSSPGGATCWCVEGGRGDGISL